MPTDMLKTFKSWATTAEKRWEPVYDQMKSDQKVYENKYMYSELSMYESRNKKPSSPKIAIPSAFRSIWTELAVVKLNLPTVDILPDGDNDDEYADLINARVQHELDLIDMPKITLDTFQDALRYKGKGLAKFEWEDGRVQADVLNPFAVLFDPKATCVENASYIRIRTPMSLSDINREKKFKALADAEMDKEGVFEPFDNPDLTAYQATASRGTVTNTDGGSETYVGGGGGDQATLGYAFVDDWWYTDPASGKEMYAEVINGEFSSYENGKEGKRGPIDNSVNSEMGYGRKPIFEIPNFNDPHTLYNKSDIEITKSVDMAINQTQNFVLEYLGKVARPVRWKLRSFFQGMNPKNWGSQKDEIIMNHATEAGFFPVSGNPGVSEGFSEALRRTHDDIVGVPDTAQGRAPSGITAASAISQVQEAGEVGIQFKIEENIKPFVTEVGNFIIFMIMKFDPNSMKDWKDTPFNIRVVGGEKRPTTRAEKLATVESLANIVIQPNSVVGIEDIMRDLDIPDANERIQRFYERQGWSPEAVSQLTEGLIGVMQADPEKPVELSSGQVAQIQLDILQQVFPSIVNEQLKELAKQGEA